MIELVLMNPHTAAEQTSPLRRGDQVVYVPPHLQSLVKSGVVLSNHNGAQPGFVTSGPNNNGDYFVRYWMIEDGMVTDELLTKANSVPTKAEWLYLHVMKSESVVHRAIQEHC